jgi:hypothetical protein
MFVAGIVAATLAAIAYGISTVLRALGAQRAASDSGHPARGDSSGPSLNSTLETFRNPAFIVGTLMVVLGFAGGAVAARMLPLFLAQTIVAGNLIVTALVGTVILGTVLRRRDLIAMAVVVGSLCILGASASHEAANKQDVTFHWTLFMVTTLLASAGLLVMHLLGRRGAIFGGALAGSMYGAVAIGVRVLDGVHPFDSVALITDPAAWTIAVGGAVAFYVQTVALQLGPVNGVTAVLVVGETGVPSVIGVLFLGDSAVDGLEWLAYAGFIGAIVGAVAVAWLTTSGAGLPAVGADTPLSRTANDSAEAKPQKPQ